VKHSSAVDTAVLANMDMIVQGNCLMTRPPDHFVNLTLSLHSDSMRTRHDAYPHGPVPKSPQPPGLVLGEAKRRNEESHRVAAKVHSGQGARDRVAKLVGHHLGIARMTGLRSQSVSYYLSNRHLIDDALSRPRDMLLPRLTVMSGLEQ
jgi:hypothetical protein